MNLPQRSDARLACSRLSSASARAAAQPDRRHAGLRPGQRRRQRQLLAQRTSQRHLGRQRQPDGHRRHAGQPGLEYRAERDPRQRRLARRPDRCFRNLKPAQRQRFDPPGQRLHAVHRANTYNGGTTVLGGTLQLASPTATLGASSGGLTVASGALLDINGDNTSVGGLNGGGTIDNVAGAFGSTPVLTVGNGGGGGTFSGTIQDSYGSTTLTKVGAGTEVLSGTNTYSGGTNVNAGVLNFAPSALGSGLVTFGGGTLQWAAGNTLDVSTSPGIAAIPSGISAGINTNGNNVTFNTGLSGAGGLTKTGAGTLTMTALNTYTGQTNISAGTIDVTEPTGLSLQYSTVNVNVNGGLVIAAPTATLGGLSGSGSVNLGAITPTALTVGANNANTTYTGVLSGGSGLTKTGTGTLTLSNSQNYNGPTDIAGGTLRASTAAPGNGLNILPTATSVTISNGATFDMSNATQSIASLNSTDGLGSQVLLSTKGLLTVGNAASSTFDGVISGSGGQVVLHGPGSMLFTGSNTYTGATTVSGGGTLQLGDGRREQRQRGRQYRSGQQFHRRLCQSLDPDSTTGVVSGSGSFVMNGPSTLQLTGNHTYSGPTVINAGTVQLGAFVNTVSGLAPTPAAAQPTAF